MQDEGSKQITQLHRIEQQYKFIELSHCWCCITSKCSYTGYLDYSIVCTLISRASSAFLPGSDINLELSFENQATFFRRTNGKMISSNHSKTKKNIEVLAKVLANKCNFISNQRGTLLSSRIIGEFLNERPLKFKYFAF